MNISENILTDARQLRQSNAQKRHIKQWIMQLLGKIGEDIKVAHQEGRTYIVYELPDVFGIPNLSEEDAKREIWATILQQLKLKNYNVTLNPCEGAFLLKIVWYSREDEDIVLYQRRIIESSLGHI